jgi:hypothetical protein
MRSQQAPGAIRFDALPAVTIGTLCQFRAGISTGGSLLLALSRSTLAPFSHRIQGRLEGNEPSLLIPVIVSQDLVYSEADSAAAWPDVSSLMAILGLDFYHLTPGDLNPRKSANGSNSDKSFSDQTAKSMHAYIPSRPPTTTQMLRFRPLISSQFMESPLREPPVIGNAQIRWMHVSNPIHTMEGEGSSVLPFPEPSGMLPCQYPQTNSRMFLKADEASVERPCKNTGWLYNTRKHGSCLDRSIAMLTYVVALWCVRRDSLHDASLKGVCSIGISQ